MSDVSPPFIIRIRYESIFCDAAWPWVMFPLTLVASIHRASLFFFQVGTIFSLDYVGLCDIIYFGSFLERFLIELSSVVVVPVQVASNVPVTQKRNASTKIVNKIRRLILHSRGMKVCLEAEIVGSSTERVQHISLLHSMEHSLRKCLKVWGSFPSLFLQPKTFNDTLACPVDNSLF